MTDDPLAYLKEILKKMKDKYRLAKVSYSLSADFNEQVRRTNGDASSST